MTKLTDYTMQWPNQLNQSTIVWGVSKKWSGEASFCIKYLVLRCYT